MKQDFQMAYELDAPHSILAPLTRRVAHSLLAPLTPRPPLPEAGRGGEKKGELGFHVAKLRKVLCCDGRNRRGQSLVEFAIVALVLYMLLAAILTFGHMLYVAQGLQGAADLAAREISRTPFHAMHPTATPARGLTFEDVVVTNPGFLDNDNFRKNIFDEAYLVINLDTFFSTNDDLFRDLVPTLPLLNQQLVTLMIVDRVVTTNLIGETQTVRYLRYPGALLRRNGSIDPPMGSPSYPSYVARDMVVGIPLVVSRTTTTPGGFETIRWIPIIEEIDTEIEASDDTLPNADPFSMDSPQKGIVALRINYPFQSASMSSFRTPVVPPDPILPGPNTSMQFEPTIGQPNAADDGAVTELNAAPGGLTGAPLSDGELYAGTYGGQFGLGAQGALGSQELTGGRPVRPYRRVISAQAIYRREVFE